MSFKPGVVCLTYDGGELCHLETVAPHLREFGLVGTFYVDPVRLLEHLPEWGALADAGHEVGNGSLFAAAGRDGELHGWTPQLVADDVLAAKELIDDLFPEQREHSLALPWKHNDAVKEHEADVVLEHYSTVKSGASKRLHAGIVHAIRADAVGCPELMGMIAEEVATSGRAVVSFRGVGVGDPAIDAGEHHRLCKELVSCGALKVETVCRTFIGAASTQSGGPRLV